ncbi:hypothetical protein ACFSTC_09750 [Nonomuraea ferruginea]
MDLTTSIVLALPAPRTIDPAERPTCVWAVPGGTAQHLHDRRLQARPRRPGRTPSDRPDRPGRRGPALRRGRPHGPGGHRGAQQRLLPRAQRPGRAAPGRRRGRAGQPVHRRRAELRRAERRSGGPCHHRPSRRPGRGRAGLHAAAVGDVRRLLRDGDTRRPALPPRLAGPGGHGRRRAARLGQGPAGRADPGRVLRADGRRPHAAARRRRGASRAVPARLRRGRGACRPCGMAVHRPPADRRGTGSPPASAPRRAVLRRVAGRREPARRDDGHPRRRDRARDPRGAGLPRPDAPPRAAPGRRVDWAVASTVLAGDFLLAQASRLVAASAPEVSWSFADWLGELAALRAARIDPAGRSRAGEVFAALLEFPSRIGAQLGGASPETVGALRSFGGHSGHAFLHAEEVLALRGERTRLDVTLPAMLAGRLSAIPDDLPGITGGLLAGVPGARSEAMDLAATGCEDAHRAALAALRNVTHPVSARILRSFVATLCAPPAHHYQPASPAGTAPADRHDPSAPVS